MKSVLIAIRPQWVEKIASGEKTIEVRKTAPQEVPFKCYIYESRNGGHRCKHCNEKDSCYSYAPKNVGCYNGSGKVIGWFICDRIEKVNAKCSDYGIDLFYHDCLTNGCLTEREIEKYFNVPEDRDLRAMKGNGYVWHISDLKIYDKPKTLAEFYKCGAESFEELSDTEDLCSYCSRTGFCEGRWCDEAYQNYLDVDFALTRMPSNWCYVEEL